MKEQVVAIAAEAHRRIWSEGENVSEQTKKSQTVCVVWQTAVLDLFGERFKSEVSLNESGPAQKIDLVDWKTRTAFELKASPNNVHMEIYRDVFKALVFNRRNPDRRLKTLVFIAPEAGIGELGESFPEDVRAIARSLKLEVVLRGI